MHVRTTTRRRNGKTYRSVQVVQSYRRPDGVPAVKVLATFGDLPELETENLKRALAASRAGKAVVFATSARIAPVKVRRNLVYADVAVMWRAWRQWRLSELIDELAPCGNAELPMGDVIGALVMQRCVEPASKLAAVEWLPTTALPEITGIKPAKFHNTRIHRALEALDAIGEPLQARLADRIEQRRAGFVHLFLDCTDTWFVGQGPALAEARVTKEGFLRRRIGIALLCDELGFPLRWATLPGDHAERDSMLGILRQVTSLPWAQGRPFVFDRALGNGSTLAELRGHDIHFVTAVPSHEIEAYGPLVPRGAFDEVVLEGDDRDHAEDREALANVARKLGFDEVSGTRFVLDLGVITKERGAGHDHQHPSRAIAVVRLAAAMATEIRSTRVTNAELADRFDVTSRSIRNWLQVDRLTEGLKRRVLQGEADRLTIDELRAVALRSASEQAHAFEHATHVACDRNVLRAPRPMLKALGPVLGLDLRVVVLFNPGRFLEQRHGATRQLGALKEQLETLNEGLLSPYNRSSANQAIGRVGAILRKMSLTDIFDVEVEHVEVEGRAVLQVRLIKNESAWTAKRALDGLTLIVAHPAIDLSGPALPDLYFAKDRVEKDIQAIKSVMKLRPVWHRTDPKVRAHVTLCMLALVLERSIAQELSTSGRPYTAARALQLLHPLHLNLYAGEPASYSPTEADATQRELLAALGMSDLIDEDTLTEVLHPR